MPYANLKIGLTKVQRQSLVDALKAIEGQMPYLVNLTPSEKYKGLRLGAKAPGFLTKATELASQNTHLLPPYFALSDMKMDVQDREILSDVLVQINKLQSAVKNTVIALEQESMRAALDFYRHCKSASENNVQGAATAIEILETMMPKKGKMKKVKTFESPTIE